MDEELVQNVAMGENFREELCVIDAKIDPKVAMDLSLLKTGGSKNLQPSNRKWSEDFLDETKPWLLIRVQSRDSFLMMQYLERHFLMNVDSNVMELMPLSEDIHVMTQGYMQQQDVDWRQEHPGGHTSWRECTRMKVMNIEREHSKMRSESSEYMLETTAAFIHSGRVNIALESYSEKFAQGSLGEKSDGS